MNDRLYTLNDPRAVTPLKNGVQEFRNSLGHLDSRLRGNDKKGDVAIF